MREEVVKAVDEIDGEFAGGLEPIESAETRNDHMDRCSFYVGYWEWLTVRQALHDQKADREKADGLLRECLGFMQSQSIDQRSWGEKLSLGEKITEHLTKDTP